MLNRNEIDTICAALRFWEEEICPHPPQLAAGYFEPGAGVSMTPAQVLEIRERLATSKLRYGAIDAAFSRMLGPTHRDLQEALAELPPDGVPVTIIISAGDRN